MFRYFRLFRDLSLFLFDRTSIGSAIFSKSKFSERHLQPELNLTPRVRGSEAE
jgi:hypothetical protein